MAKLVELTAAAVLGYLVDKADLVESVRGWLKRDPASLAYQRALLRAYAAFVRSDPALAKSFFDETFLTHAAVPELAKQLTRHEHASSAELAQLWAGALYGDARAAQRQAWATEPRVVSACADFLQWLENELKREQVFQPLFDSRALDGLDAKFDELVRLLTAERDEARAHAQAYQPVIERITQTGGVSIAGDAHVGGDVVGGNKSITLNYHAYFGGSFTTLEEYYKSPASVFERVRVDEFVGRGWLEARLDAFLNAPVRSKGVFLLEGEAGVGKTSFLAHLVRERGYLHLFAELVPGDNVEPALLSLAAQLVSRYRLAPYADRNTLPAIAGDTQFLDRLLKLATQRLAAGEKIIVVCDALDEAGIGRNENPFGLPTTLPENVYLVVSQRPVRVPLQVQADRHLERLKPDDDENLHDMQAYLQGMASRPAIAQQLRARHYSEQEFVQVLTEKSGGVWMYLRYVLDEIQRGLRHPLELEQLPQGLVGYYLAYWDDWRTGRNGRGKGEDAWYALYLPLLSTLAAVPEPIPLDTLIEWAGVDAQPHEVRNLLREHWRAFLSERDQSKGPARFILYHASLRDFLTGKVDTHALASADVNFVDELCAATQAAHERIVANFSRRCRGEWTDLIPADYARRYLTFHLEGAGQYDTLRQMVAWSDAWAKARYDKEESWSGYLTDLDRVWAFAEHQERVGWQIRCALLESTVHSLAGNIFPQLLVQLVEVGWWSPARALAHIPHMPGDSEKAEALRELVKLLPVELLREALGAARDIQHEDDRVRALSGLAPHLPVELMPEALAAARSIQSEYSRAQALSGLAPHLPASEQASVLSEALAAAQGIQDERFRAQALSGLVPHLPETEHAFVLSEALAAARGIQSEYSRALALSGLAPHLSATEKASVLSEALAVARSIQDESSRARALSELAQHLPATEQVSVLSEALAAVQGIQDEYFRAQMLSGLAPHLPVELMPEALAAARSIQSEYSRAQALSELAPHLSATEKASVLSEALAVARSIQDEYFRAQTLSGLTPHLPVELIPEALAAARGIQDEDDRAEALSGLAPHLPATEQVSVLSEALAAAQGIQDERFRAQALSGLAPHLPATEQVSVLSEALAAVQGIQDEYFRAQMLSGLAPHLPATEQASVLSEALAAVQGIQDEYSRAQTLSGLAPHLPATEQASVLSEALAAARSIQDEYSRAQTLSELAPHLSATEKASVLSEALAAARSIQDEYFRAQTLSGLAPHLSATEKASVLSEALAVARSIQDESSRARALSELAQHLPATEQTSVLSEALAAVRGIQDKDSRALALSGLAPHLPVELMPEALAAARGIQDEDARAEALSELAQHLTTAEQFELLPEIFETVVLSNSVLLYERSSLLGKVVGTWKNLSFAQCPPALWKKGLRSLARHSRDELLDDLTALLPMIEHLGGQEALNEMFFALRDVSRWWR